MLINILLQKIQALFKPVYEKSFVLQNIDWLIGVNIFLVIFQSTYAQSDSIGYFAIFAIILTLLKLFIKPEEKINLSIIDKFLVVYFLLVVISVAGSSLFYLSLKGFFKTATYIGFYASVISYLKDNKNCIKYIFLTISLAAAFETIVAFMQNFGAVEEISGWQDMSRLNPEEVMTRVYGSLKPYNPNLFGGYMLSIIPAFITLPFINKRLTLPACVLGITSAIAIFLTGCRGAYIGLFFEFTILIGLTYKFLKTELKKIFSVFLAFISTISVSILLSVSSLRARIFSIFVMRNDSSNSFRFNVYNSCINMFKDNWLLGIGCGNQNFREIYGLYMRTGFDALSAYNIYLETAVESGIFALLSFISFITLSIYKAIKFINTSKSTETVYVSAAVISIIGLLTHGIVDTVFFRPQIQFTFWIMIGIIRVIAK